MALPAAHEVDGHGQRARLPGHPKRSTRGGAAATAQGWSLGGQNPNFDSGVNHRGRPLRVTLVHSGPDRPGPRLPPRVSTDSDITTDPLNPFTVIVSSPRYVFTEAASTNELKMFTVSSCAPAVLKCAAEEDGLRPSATAPISQIRKPLLDGFAMQPGSGPTFILSLLKGERRSGAISNARCPRQIAILAFKRRACFPRGTLHHRRPDTAGAAG